MNFYSMTDAAIAAELGARLQRQRLNMNLTQTEVAFELGVTKPTIIQLEKGIGKITTLIGALRVLGMLDQVELLVGEVEVSPLQLMKMQGKTRQRAAPMASELKQAFLFANRSGQGAAKLTAKARNTAVKVTKSESSDGGADW